MFIFFICVLANKKRKRQMDVKNSNNNEQKTLWMGNVLYAWTENFLRSIFASTGEEVVKVKIIRKSGNPNYNSSEACYAFIEFNSYESARTVLNSLNGQQIPGYSLTFKLNWGSRKERSTSSNSNYSFSENTGTRLSKNKSSTEILILSEVIDDDHVAFISPSENTNNETWNNQSKKDNNDQKLALKTPPKNNENTNWGSVLHNPEAEKSISLTGKGFESNDNLLASNEDMQVDKCNSSSSSTSTTISNDNDSIDSDKNEESTANECIEQKCVEEMNNQKEQECDKSLYQPNSQIFDLYIGNLSSDATAELLTDFFQDKYSSFIEANVVTHFATGFCKGYGFIRLGDEKESQRVIDEMQGEMIGGRSIRLAMGKSRNNIGASNNAEIYDPHNIILSEKQQVIFVGGISDDVDAIALTNHFKNCGEIEDIKIRSKICCAFIKFSKHQEAQIAVKTMNNTMLGTYRLRVGWGKLLHKSNGSSSNHNTSNVHKSHSYHYQQNNIYQHQKYHHYPQHRIEYMHNQVVDHQLHSKHQIEYPTLLQQPHQSQISPMQGGIPYGIGHHPMAPIVPHSYMMYRPTWVPVNGPTAPTDIYYSHTQCTNGPTTVNNGAMHSPAAAPAAYPAFYPQPFFYPQPAPPHSPPDNARNNIINTATSPVNFQDSKSQSNDVIKNNNKFNDEANFNKENDHVINQDSERIKKPVEIKPKCNKAMKIDLISSKIKSSGKNNKTTSAIPTLI